MTFEEKLAIGQRKEKKVAEFLRRTGRCKAYSFNQDAEYDIVTDAHKTYEVKDDISAKKTGNLCFPIAKKFRPTGVSITEAHVWVHSVGDTAWFVPTPELRSFLMSSFKGRRFVPSQHKSMSDLVLAPIEIFDARFKRYKRNLNECKE